MLPAMSGHASVCQCLRSHLIVLKDSLTVMVALCSQVLLCDPQGLVPVGFDVELAHGTHVKYLTNESGDHFHEVRPE